ncbi:methyltransferase [Candidatus Woesearchaeota archaeon]|nr:methyltransferase [Candidatus Woesearchaeota archaeon]
MDYLIKKYKDIEVAWLPELNGGGMTHGQQFIPIVRKVYGKVDRIFEFCAGPGFIGFSLLAEGLCNSLCVADANPSAVKALKETIRRNRLADRVSIYLSNGLNDIPKTERWDLVVANPPHFNAKQRKPRSGSRLAGASSAKKTPEFWLIEDHDWKIHKDFYLKVQKFLKPHGKILMQENYLGSEEKDFIKFIELGRLSLKRSFMYKVQDEKAVNSYYFLEIENTSQAKASRFALSKLRKESHEQNEAELPDIRKADDFISQDNRRHKILSGLLMQREDIKPIRLVYPQQQKRQGASRFANANKRAIKLAPWQKYRFELKNSTQRCINAGFYRENPPAFFKQKSMLSVPPGGRKKSSIFHLTKGAYIFIDLDTKEKIAEVKVE